MDKRDGMLKTAGVTTLEANLLREYALDQMNPSGGSEPECSGDVSCYVWADERAGALGISAKGVGGVLSSLTQKGLAAVFSDDPDDGFCFTEAGYKVYDQLRTAGFYSETVYGERHDSFRFHTERPIEGILTIWHWQGIGKPTARLPESAFTLEGETVVIDSGCQGPFYIDYTSA